jgi:hypothetical protein
MRDTPRQQIDRTTSEERVVVASASPAAARIGSASTSLADTGRSATRGAHTRELRRILGIIIPGIAIVRLPFLL